MPGRPQRQLQGRAPVPAKLWPARPHPRAAPAAVRRHVGSAAQTGTAIPPRRVLVGKNGDEPVPGRIVWAAAILGLSGLAVQAGEARRVWSDPPPASEGPVPERGPETVLPAASWPDEAQRRLPTPASVRLAAPVPVEAAPAGSRRGDTGEAAEPPRPVAEALPDAPTVSSRTRRRLGPLAGFAGAAAAPGPRSAAPTTAASGAAAAQPALGRMRILQLRKGRVVVIYTRS
jgi:hypothetical protein